MTLKEWFNNLKEKMIIKAREYEEWTKKKREEQLIKLDELIEKEKLKNKLAQKKNQLNTLRQKTHTFNSPSPLESTSHIKEPHVLFNSGEGFYNTMKKKENITDIFKL